ncbi:uncharacterized mitochondrial protein AtMg00810-like [Gossypium hirsutum]|uniref:Uncharacterized mitochondrial protein AtMg00810-like n=1 Tax=Gossypium hirsutum TaxID=3635 RepID=A0ABM2ZI02_GOSHI|nr:uncharacterized mitochondrial protein AtMg00810-like [Gossypium hirsutum]
MLPPHGFSHDSTKVCKLHKSIYGLKQASRQWFSKLTKALISLGYIQSTTDHSMFTKKHSEDFTVLLIYVDDIILTGTSSPEIMKVKQFLDTTFRIKDLGDLKYFLVLEVARTSQGIHISQQKYALKILQESGFIECKPAKTPMATKSVYKLTSTDGELLSDITSYRQLVGKLLYLTSTRPDLTFAVQQLSQFMDKPTTNHLQAAHRVLRYLKGCPSTGLFYPASSSFELKAFSDSNWAGCPETRRSITGYCIFFGEALISWRAKKQPTVSRSSSEAEYRALASTICEVQWLHYLLCDLHVPISHATPVFYDNKSTIQIASNPTFHECTKHIEIDCHIVREKLQKDVVHLLPCTSSTQLADLFTKALAAQPFQDMISKLGMLNIHSPA